MNRTVACVYKSATEVICNGTSFKVEEPMLTVNDAMFWVYLGIYVFLVLGAGEYSSVKEFLSPFRSFVVILCNVL